jgi:NADPH2:quinone reductase
MAKRIQFSQHGGPEVLHLVDFEPATPGPQQVRVRNHAIGLNFIDTYFRSGLYAPPALPSGLGTEGAGVVEAVGDQVTRLKVGDSISYEQAAAVMLKGLTVQYLLKQTYAVQPGDTILFHAAAGGVGSLACQWAKALGARLIGTVSSAEKAERAKALGAWATIDYSREDVAQRVLELTDGKKCSVVYDGVGQDTWLTSLDCLAPRGLMVSFGNASGAVSGVNLGILAQKGSLYVTRPTLASYANNAANTQVMADDLFAMIASGKVTVDIQQRYALSDAAKAQTELSARRTVGSTVLLP